MKSKNKVLFIGVVLLISILVSGNGVFAETSDSITNNININSGEFSIQMDKTQPNLLDWEIGKNPSLQHGFDIPSLTITDYRGTGDGWRVTISATPFTEVEPELGFVEGTSAKIISNGSLYLDSDSSKPKNDFRRNDKNVLRLPELVNRTIDDIIVQELTLYSVPSGFGLGKFDFYPVAWALKPTLPDNFAYTDKINYPNVPTPYETTITLKLYDTP